MKSLVSNVHAVVEGILADCSRAYPSLVSEFVRDKHRLSSQTIERGLGLFVLDLPNLDGILTDALETGSLVLSGPLSRAVSKKVRVPAFMRGLWLLIFDRRGTLRLDPDPTAIDLLRQIFCFAKKLVASCTAARNNAAIKEFVDVENKMRRSTLDWVDDAPFDGHDTRGLSFGRLYHDLHAASGPALFEDDFGGLCEEDSHLLERLDSICRDVSTRFGLYSPVDYDRSLLENGLPSGTKNGPGAVSDRKATQEKFCFDYWPDKLQFAFPIDYFGSYANATGMGARNHEHPSKLHLVPKTAKTPRLIASEPSYHQWCQQLTRTFLENELKKVFKGNLISLQDQSKSHPLVRTGSLDASLATVDLSAASDRLSCWTVERVFASNLSLLNAFKASRTRVMSHSRTAHIEPLFLKKFSTMGSALTFPVQSIVFACIALASLPGKPRLDDQLERYSKVVRVYGDDIIIPVSGYANLTRLLGILGLKVNDRKSFYRGNFRESCGYDAYRGYDVTPVKPRSLSSTSPEGRKSLIDLSNNLFLKGLWRAAEVVRSLLPTQTLKSLPVVSVRSGSLGMASFTGGSTTGLLSRFNSNIQQVEVLSTSYTSKIETTYTEGTDYTLQSLIGLHSRKAVLPAWDAPSRSSLGRVVKAVTRERRSWVVLDTVLCAPPIGATH